ncbi:putative bifunctional diguanylate cyclase/phosphodiesterase [Caproiciproducens sp.]|uniref:putative bifunctional diguanylate cyclase/phosphodiesterase n=1 Tax=Caproiciproducens sp. TaxID=1954376 RepID=UPI002897E940|nr:bifunctional diguanylate cyclase/phosphodiesterase [Caproiciproducens sp.]
MKQLFKKSDSKFVAVAVIFIGLICLSAFINHGGNIQEAAASALMAFIFCAFVFYIFYSRRRQESELEKIAYYDSLTGISSIYKFEMDVAQRLKQDSCREYSILVFDVNKIAIINDAYGRQTMDGLLRGLSRALAEGLREGELCARSAEGLFLVFLQSKNDKEVLDFIHCFVDRARQLSNAGFLQKQAFSFGIYPVSDKNTAVRQMIDRANLAREAATDSMCGNYAFFDESMCREMLRNREIEDQMEEALGENQFIVFYQPKYHLPDNGICGAEALVRWDSPKFGLLPPDKFIPVFEKKCLIVDLDLNVLEQVCRQLRKWFDMGLDPAPVSVNISKIDLYRPDFVDTICKPLLKYKIPPNFIELELTESAVFHNKQLFVTLVGELRRIGFRLSMDDFGTGYSSLNTLKCLKLDVLKLDRGFFIVSDERERLRSEVIINNIIKMAKQLHITTVAEGIETKKQAEFLEKAGCDAIQGFYFAKPMPAGDYEKVLQEQRDNRGKAGA